MKLPIESSPSPSRPALQFVTLKKNTFHGSLNVEGQPFVSIPNLWQLDISFNNISGIIPFVMDRYQRAYDYRYDDEQRWLKAYRN